MSDHTKKESHVIALTLSQTTDIEKIHQIIDQYYGKKVRTAEDKIEELQKVIDVVKPVMKQHQETIVELESEIKKLKKS